jgi:CBS domain containing-hemolysin-like protein
MISSVLEFTDTVVREVMVPRTDMVTIAADASPDELLAAIVEHGFTRLPVIGEDIDDVVGVVIAKDLLPYLRRGSSPPRLREVMRPIDFVPETKKVAELLRQMQRSKTHLAVVVDEFGGTAGLVTIEDLLEELVGEIVDEYDEHDVLVSELGANAWRVDGRLPVTDLAEAVGVALPDDEWDTVGGLVLALAGRLPEEAETFTFGPLEFSASQVQGRRVAEVVVRRRWDVEVSAERGGE